MVKNRVVNAFGDMLGVLGGINTLGKLITLAGPSVTHVSGLKKVLLYFHHKWFNFFFYSIDLKQMNYIFYVSIFETTCNLKINIVENLLSQAVGSQAIPLHCKTE